MLKVLAGALAISLLTALGTIGEANASVSFINIDLSGTANPNDTAKGIECGDPNSVYVTIFQQGLLAKIDILGRNVLQLIDDPDSAVVSPSFQNFADITRDPNTGNLFIIEQENGKIWRFNPSLSGADAWTRKSLVEAAVDTTPGDGLPGIIYPLGFDVRPTRVSFNTDADPVIEEMVEFSAGLEGVVEFANGSIYAAVDYFADFSDTVNTQGVADLLFVGVAKVNPNTMVVQRISLLGNGAAAIGGMVVDSVEPNILWLTDPFTDQVFKYNTNTDTVVSTITLAGSSFPRGIANSDDTVFVALNKAGPGNTIIARINKSTLAVGTPIDTGAPITNLGARHVFFNNGLLAWTDSSGHVGITDTSTGETSFDTIVPNAQNGFFGCVPLDGEFWFAAQGSAKVGISPHSKFSVGRPIRATSGSCNSWLLTNDPTRRGRCTTVDITPPQIVSAFVTPSDYLCVETKDDTGTVSLSYNGKQIPRWAGSGNGSFCTNEELPAVIKVVAEDGAGNKSEKIAINAQKILATRTEQSFTAVLAKELNPHKNIEGVILTTNQPLKQIRLAKSPEFSDRELYISEKGIMELNGKQTVKVIYKGQYGKERHGQLYVFATNIGKLATFDIVVKDDIKLYRHQDKQRHGTYSLDLRNLSSLDEISLNAWQKEELERVFAGEGELTIVQKNILSMVLRMTNK